MPPALSLYSVKGLLEDLEIAGVANLFSCILNPLLLQSVLRWAIGFVKHTEHAREWKRRELVCGDFVGDVVPQLVLRRIVPFSFLDQFEAAALLRVGRIEDVRKKFDAFAQAFDDAEALVVHRALDQLHHVWYLRGVCAGDKR